MNGTPDDLSRDARAGRWAADLATWAIPEEIVSQAPESPWIHPVAMFTADDDIPESPSSQIARAALPDAGSVLDVGCGGGRASMALVPPAAALVGVDHQEGMLAAYREAADRRGVAAATHLGDWPDIADEVPTCDVVVCHHVVYNVAAIVPFLAALDAHAHRRVVIELPVHHPLTSMNPLWMRFWGLERPTRPTSTDLLGIARTMGFAAQIEHWTDRTWGDRVDLPDADRVRYARVRLCLTDDRDAEVAAALVAEADAVPRQVSTIWWDRQP